ncbi:hypothetical protein ASPZODRAFT_137197 [Penicilliopsis zonata CBS 506.65]|uniref:Uncharacterized protein n=1 Tax=Penicilliopsis zonata CBS 506.65 TaxID=1073090 RepID=A0A1L9S5Y0_9EURO|nr:hypothetical protein ASPZODRAFT_137197 [Penicilliopsis zonata CBS 506.65]OJJ42579.1 hypothetical protein ASPZODRAFT_137197 [Penicilliopsis zonata CBS 506.65]
MHFQPTLVASLAIALPALALPTSSSASQASLQTAVPGESSLFVNYQGKNTPLAAEYLRAIPATGSGPAGADDLLFQNLLAAEWAIYSFYQLGAEMFDASDFPDPYPNTTYERLVQIRDNEAGHVRIFQDQISNNSVTPGPCQYNYNETIQGDPVSYLALQVFLEVSSMAFLTGLINQASLNISKSALVAIGQVESRHNTWALIDAWDVNPFSGPSDTIYPYPNQILDSTNTFIVDGSCPSINPIYPDPRQNLPQLSFNKTGTTGTPGSEIQIVFKQADNQPSFDADTDYYAVFYHGLDTISVPFDTSSNTTTIPAEFDKEASIIIVNIADEKGAPTQESVVAGPLIILEQPGDLTLEINTA